MTTIEKTWTQFPGRPLAQADLIERLPAWVAGDRLRLATQLFRRAAVRTRHLVATPEELLTHGRTFARKNAIYRRTIQHEVGALCDRIRADATAGALRGVDLLITASCTGFQIPAMDALVMRRLELPLGLRRVNLTQHGCAAGAAALGIAHEWLAARPDARALVICAELCSLAFQPEDRSDENLVSAAIFGDGAAAALLAGPGAAPAERGAVRVRATMRELFPGTEHFMGFDVDEAGLKIKLSRDVVPFAETRLPALLTRAAAAWGVPGVEAFEVGALHPGGRRILEVFEDRAGLSRAVTRTSWDCLGRYGNLSSVSVLAALHELVEAKDALRPGAIGLVAAFGPGFCAELALLEVAP